MCSSFEHLYQGHGRWRSENDQQEGSELNSSHYFDTRGGLIAPALKAGRHAQHTPSRHYFSSISTPPVRPAADDLECSHLPRDHQGPHRAGTRPCTRRLFSQASLLQPVDVGGSDLCRRAPDDHFDDLDCLHGLRSDLIDGRPTPPAHVVCQKVHRISFFVRARDCFGIAVDDTRSVVQGVAIGSKVKNHAIH